MRGSPQIAATPCAIALWGALRAVGLWSKHLAESWQRGCGGLWGTPALDGVLLREGVPAPCPLAGHPHPGRAVCSPELPAVLPARRSGVPRWAARGC